MKHKKLKLKFSFKKKAVILTELVVLGILLIMLGYQNYAGFKTYVNQKPLSPSLKNSVIKTIHSQESSSAAIKASPAPKAASLSADTLPYDSGRSISVPILYYHYIGNNPNPSDIARYSLSIPPDSFDAEMNYLSTNGWHPITLDTLYAALEGKASLPPKPIVLTFDDGYIDFYLNAFPILRKYGFHAISFIPTGLINTSYYMSWSQIQQINATGLVAFEAHSVHHPNLDALSPGAVDYEITESKKVLEAETGKTVNFFAYPYGASNGYVRSEVQKAGFVGGLGTWGSYTETEGDIYDWPRIRVPGQATLSQFISIL